MHMKLFHSKIIEVMKLAPGGGRTLQGWVGESVLLHPYPNSRHSHSL